MGSSANTSLCIEEAIVRSVLSIVLLCAMPSLTSGQQNKDESYQELEKRVISIFANNCARSGCHAGTDPQQGMNLSKDRFFGHTVNAPSRERPEFNIIEPGHPDSSYLFMKMTGDKRIAGAQMPLTGDKLDEEEVNAIKSWINKLPESRQLKKRIAGAEPKYAHPFDGWSLINIPTNRMVEQGKWLFLIGHRFLPKLSSGYSNLYGIDGPANILLSMGYAFSDNTLLNMGRSRVEGNVNLQLKHRVLRQTLSESMPVGVTAQGTVNWLSTAVTDNRFQGKLLKYTGQVSITREVIDGVGITVTPGILFNPDIERTGESPLVTVGLGGRWRVHRNISIIGEWNAIVAGYTLTSTFGNPNRFDSWGTGLEIAVGGHVFQVFLTNSLGTTTDQYLRGGDLDIRNESLRLGFNIYRVLDL
ncbi:MAG: DUF5777 family beta-barrel protein [Candidatus Halalkalibacterium sp. M3_1C_030]